VEQNEKRPNWMNHPPMFQFYQQVQAAGVELEPDPGIQPAAPVSFHWPYLLVPLGVIAVAGAGIGGALFLKRSSEANEEDAE